MRTCSSLLVVVVAAAVAVVSVYPVSTSAAGYWYPIGDVNAPHVQELGGWAVAEHERRGHDGLKFGKVLSGEEQSVAGVKYHLVVDAVNGDSKDGRYEAVLIEEDRSNTRRLISFGPAN